MKTSNTEPENTSDLHQKTEVSIRGLIIILRGMLREKLATTDKNTLAYFQFHTSNAKMKAIDLSEPDFSTLWDVYLCLYAAGFGHPENQSPVKVIREIVQAMRPYAILPEGDGLSPVGRIAWLGGAK